MIKKNYKLLFFFKLQLLCSCLIYSQSDRLANEFLLIPLNNYSHLTDVNSNNFTDWNNEYVSDKVSKVINVMYLITKKFDEPVNVPFDSTIITFDNAGNYLSKNKYFRSAKSEESNYEYYDLVDYEYNSSKCLKQIKHKQKVSYVSTPAWFINFECEEGLNKNAKYSHLTSGDDNEKLAYFYDSNGNINKLEKYKIKHHYDNSKHVFFEEEILENIWVIQYNQKNKIFEIKDFDEDGVIKSKTKFNYDINNNLVSVELSDKSQNWKILKSINYSYNEKKQIIKEVFKDNSNSSYEFTNTLRYGYSYNQNGTIKKIRIEKFDEQFTKYNQKYISSDGYQLEQIIDFEIYDDKGNWLEKIQTNTDHTKYKYIRKIDYN